MILTSGLNACKSRRGVATQKTDILNSTHWSLRKSLIPKIDNMSKLGYPSQKSQKLRYFERKEVILAFTRDPHAMAAMSKWCETETNTSVHWGRSTHTTCPVTNDLLVVPECLILSYLLRMVSFNLSSDCASTKCTCSPIQFNSIQFYLNTVKFIRNKLT